MKEGAEVMFEIDVKSRKPISEQIVDNFKELIVSGVMVAGEKVPSVREMAARLTVNPNTVQKAYRTLEQQGYIYTSAGRGTFVESPDSVEVQPQDIEQARSEVREAISKLYYLGISKKEAEKTIKELLDERGDWK